MVLRAYETGGLQGPGLSRPVNVHRGIHRRAGARPAPTVNVNSPEN